MTSKIYKPISWAVIIIFLAVGSNSCKDSELDDAMDMYCNCINNHKGDDLGRYRCVEIMDSLQNEYATQPRRLNKIIEKAGDCL